MRNVKHKPFQNPSGAADFTAYHAIKNIEKACPAALVRFETDIPPSVNHAYITTRKGQRILTNAAKMWVLYAGIKAKTAAQKHGWAFSSSGKLVMEIWAYWPDNKKRDIHNLHKLIADAFEDILYKDDRNVLIRDMDFYIDRENPRVEICVRGFSCDDGK